MEAKPILYHVNGEQVFLFKEIKFDSDNVDVKFEFYKLENDSLKRMIVK